MTKRNRRKMIVTGILMIIVVALTVLTVTVLKMFGFDIEGYVSLIIAAASAVLIVIELMDARKMQRAEFVLSLNQSFVENEHYAALYTKLEEINELRKEKNYEEIKNYEIKRIEVSNYLTFFEAIYLLLEEKVIDMKVLDDLFGYRFFLAVHNSEIQRIKLVASPGNFKNIYYLEDEWMEYRRKHKIAIFMEENSLKEACKKANKLDEYDKIINYKNNKNKKKKIK